VSKLIDPSVVQFEQALLDLDDDLAARLLRGSGSPLGAARLDALVVPALERLGTAWDRGDISLSELYLSARLCQRIVMAASPGRLSVRDGQPRLAIGILEDSHVLGKEIVVALLQSAGYEVSDWGARLSAGDIAARVAAEGTQVLFISVLMLRAAMAVRGLRDQLDLTVARPVIVVGGAPFRFDPELAGDVGADYVGRTASDALGVLAGIAAGAGRRG
jgi:methanogenic corrinoid protein MtbC1